MLHYTSMSNPIVMFAAIVLSATSPALAALGQPEASIEGDRQSLGGERTTAVGPSYSVATITSTGLTVREYVSPDGIIFAVSWRGIGIPNLSVLLGDYFQAYEDARSESLKKEPKLRGPMAFATADLIIETGGHMRDLWGRAVAPALLPPSVTLQDIR